MDGKGFPFGWINVGSKTGFAHRKFCSHFERNEMSMKEESGKILGEV